jgi:hypothetical protein
MLSHLVGSSNRADIRRLRALEEDNAQLQAELSSQRRGWRHALAERDAPLRRLEAQLDVCRCAAPAYRNAAAHGPGDGRERAILDVPKTARSPQPRQALGLGERVGEEAVTRHSGAWIDPRSGVPEQALADEITAKIPDRGSEHPARARDAAHFQDRPRGVGHEVERQLGDRAANAPVSNGRRAPSASSKRMSRPPSRP